MRNLFANSGSIPSVSWSVENARLLAGNGKTDYCVGCFTGEYPCEPPKRRYVNKYARKLSEKSDTPQPKE